MKVVGVFVRFFVRRFITGIKDIGQQKLLIRLFVRVEFEGIESAGTSCMKINCVINQWYKCQ
jgi:hypothetical protein